MGRSNICKNLLSIKRWVLNFLYFFSISLSFDLLFKMEILWRIQAVPFYQFTVCITANYTCWLHTRVDCIHVLTTHMCWLHTCVDSLHVLTAYMCWLHTRVDCIHVLTTQVLTAYMCWQLTCVAAYICWVPCGHPGMFPVSQTPMLDYPWWQKHVSSGWDISWSGQEVTPWGAPGGLSNIH